MWRASAIRDVLGIRRLTTFEQSDHCDCRDKVPGHGFATRNGLVSVMFLRCFDMCPSVADPGPFCLKWEASRIWADLEPLAQHGPITLEYLGLFFVFVSAFKGHFSAKLWLQGTSQRSLLLTQRSMVGRCILQKLALLMVASFSDTTSECLDGLLQLWSWSKNPLKDMAKICRTFSLFYQFMMKFSWKKLASKPCHYYQL